MKISALCLERKFILPNSQITSCNACIKIALIISNLVNVYMAITRSKSKPQARQLAPEDICPFVCKMTGFFCRCSACLWPLKVSPAH